jgi:serine/threonine protein kinase
VNPPIPETAVMTEMSPAEAIFFAALKRPPEERATFLDQACAGDAELRGRLDKMLAAQAHLGDFLDPPQPGLAVTGPEAPSAVAEVPGTVIAAKYKLLQRIGEGGMGSVWMADQLEPVKRRVAVKLIRAERDSSATILARFEAERQAIALMDHPHIAKLLDAGTVGASQPYFVMELVKGIPLNDYCDQHKLNIADRLNLFMQICSAVQHAHQKGIIHRDLKPTNILVEAHDDKAVPKVIDFGLAKATSGMQLTEHTLFTQLGSVAGTPLYMAPEQAKFNALDIDTRADVYALGVILYELLTGTTPIEREQLKTAAFDEILRVIRESEPPTPSKRLSSTDSKPSVSANRQSEPLKLARFLRGDLDWIVMKALAKERDRRYETANGFAKDIERFLNHEPVLAGPPSAAYRLRKFVRRNRAQVIAGSLLLAALLIGIAGTTFGLIWAEVRRGEAERARANEAVQRGIAQGNATKALLAADAEKTAKEHEAEQRTRAEKARDRTAQALDDMTSSITGDSLATQKAISEEQKRFLTEVLTYYQEFAGEKADDEKSRARTAAAARRVGDIEYRLGRWTEAVTALRLARDGYAQLAAEFPTVPAYRFYLASSHHGLGILLTNLGMLPEADEQFRNALSILEKLIADFPTMPTFRRGMAQSHLGLGHLLAHQGKGPEAMEHLRKTMTLREKLAVEFPNEPTYRQELAQGHVRLGALFIELGKGPEAEEQLRTALDIQGKLLAEFPTTPEYRFVQAGSRTNLGRVLADQDKKPEAEEQLRKALAIAEKLVAEFPAMPAYRELLAGNHNNLGGLLADLGMLPEAEEQYRKALAINKKLADDFPAVPQHRQALGSTHNNLGILLDQLKKFPEEVQEYRQALAIHEKLVAQFPAVPAHRQIVASSLHNWGVVLAVQGKGVEAEERFRKGSAIREKLVAEFPDVPAYRKDLAESHNSLGLVLTDTRKLPEAEEQFQKAVIVREKLAADYPAVSQYQVKLGGSYLNLGLLIRHVGRPRDSLEWFSKANRTLRTVYKEDPRSALAKQFLRNSHEDRALAYERLQQYADAARDWDEVIELTPPQEQLAYRVARATSHVKAGQVAEAVAEVAELMKLPGVPASALHDFARVYAIASGKNAGKKTEYADRAMDMLQKAVQVGYIDAAHLKMDTDLDAIRERDDFKKLIADLEKKTPAKPEKQP